MKFYKMVFILLIGLGSVSANANDSFNSEMSHVVGGAVMGGGITAVVDRYYPEYKEDRGMIGFGISSLTIVAFESVTVALRGDAKGQLLDVASHIAGSAFGAFVTDKFILSPVVKNSTNEGKFIGLQAAVSF
ncbi:MAG: hypothetical protein Q7T91_05025 [Sulfuricurvum sp.]|nr:hypothetical protein [Sulfuricurvum sp.]